MSGRFVHATADVDPSAEIGEGTKVWNNVQIREKAVIGVDCIVLLLIHVYEDEIPENFSQSEAVSAVLSCAIALAIQLVWRCCCQDDSNKSAPRNYLYDTKFFFVMIATYSTVFAV